MATKVKKRIIPYSKQSVSGSDIQEVVKVLKSDWITQGSKIKEFEDALCNYTGARYAVCVSSGTAALHLACLAAGISKGDEVITSSITFIASANAILYCGGKPVFADIQKDTVNIDPEEIKKKIARRIKAIIPVHFAGLPCEMEEISRIAQRNKLIVIEDAAHALGAEYKLKDRQRWIRIGSCFHSDMTILSFHPVKSITTGEGGAVLTNSRQLYKRLLMLRNHGINKEKVDFVNPKPMLHETGSWYYEMQDLGFNYRITDFQCALGISQLKKLDHFIRLRIRVADMYNQELSDVDGFILPHKQADVKSAWHIYCLRVKDQTKRKRIFSKLRDAGILVQVHYIPVHLQPYYRRIFGYKEGDYPFSEEYYKQTISLPLYPSITTKEIQYVIRTLKEALA